MVHVNDGMLAITSDSMVYLLKFNYDTVFQHDFVESGQQFAKVVCKVSLKTVAPSVAAKSEIPQIIFAPSQNLIFLIFSDSAQLFSVTQIEFQAHSLDVYQVSGWKKRAYRGLTKEIGGLVLSAVGKDGLDVYKIVEKDLRFLKNLKLSNFGLNTTMEVVDFAVIEHPPMEGMYSLFLLDKECGLLLIDMHYQTLANFGFKSWITFQSGGISVDTVNGKNVFMAYSHLRHNYVIEFDVDIDQGLSFEIQRKIIHHRIVDVDATDQFVIIQGQNQHHILFSNGYEDVMPHQKSQVFTHVGLRDFEFFNQSYTQDQEINNEQFFFGITAQSAFLTRFQVEPIKIVCFYDHEENIGVTFQYQLQYNTTVANEQELIQQHIMDFKVQVIQTYFFTTQKFWVYVTLGVYGILQSMLLLILFFRIFRQKKEEKFYSDLLETAKGKRISKTANGSTIKGDETSVFQIQNKSLAP